MPWKDIEKRRADNRERSRKRRAVDPNYGRKCIEERIAAWKQAEAAGKLGEVTRRCCICKEVKSLEFFSPTSIQCRPCNNEAHRLKEQELSLVRMAEWNAASEAGELDLLRRKCSLCKNELALSLFPPASRRCRNCLGTRGHGKTNAERYAYRRANGLCVKCCVPTTNALCDGCRDNTNADKAKRRENGCTNCLKPTENGKKTCDACLSSRRSKFRERVANGLCGACGRLRFTSKNFCVTCAESRRNAHRSVKDRVFAAYGGYRCACCGETRKEFLQIDHINNDGYEHRKKIGKSKLYSWLNRHKFPAGFQVLCANCNFAKGHFGECPHVRERVDAMVW